MADSIYTNNGRRLDVGGGGGSYDIKGDSISAFDAELSSSFVPIPNIRFGFISDIHGSQSDLQNFVDKSHDFAVSGMFHLGDTCYDYVSDGYAFWNNVADAKYILNTNGNHDACTRESGGYHGWGAVDRVAEYQNLFKPYIANWGVVQPSNAEANGLMYYYKDFTKTSGNNTAKVRIIILDGIWSRYDNGEQLSWFSSVLSNAKADGFAVIVGCHFPSGEVNAIEGTPFHTPNEKSVASDLKNKYNTTETSSPAHINAPDGIKPSLPEGYANAVDAFQTSGGQFICWMCGHLHYNIAGTLQSYPKQIQIGLASSKAGFNYHMLQNNSYRGCFNVLNIDLGNKALTLLQYGTTISRDGAKLNTLVLNWATRKLVYTD